MPKEVSLPGTKTVKGVDSAPERGPNGHPSVASPRNGRGSLAVAYQEAEATPPVNGRAEAPNPTRTNGSSTNGLHAEGTAVVPGGPPSARAPIEILSLIEGRVSLRYPACRRNPALARGVEAALRSLPGVVEAGANPLTGRVQVRFDPARMTVEQIEERIAAAEPLAATPPIPVVVPGSVAAEIDDCCGPDGCEPGCTDPCCAPNGALAAVDDCCAVAYAPDKTDDEFRAHRTRLMVGGVGIVVLLGSTLAFGAAAATSPLLVAGATVATVISGYPFFRRGLRSLTGRAPLSTDTLVTTATVASLVLGEGITALVVLWLLNLGELLRDLTLRRTRRAIRDLLSVGDRDVWIVVDGLEVKVPIESLQEGDTVAVYADEKIPVDGVVLEGIGTVNQAPITGESMPVYKNPGDEVFAGTVLELGSLRVRATKVGSETAVGRLIERVEQAHELRAPIETVAEGFSRRFIPVSFALAGLVFLLTGDIRRALTMLVIACPCAAGLSTPTAVSASIGNGAKRGILIKGGVHLEAAGQLDTVVLDKTGTLTTGKAIVTTVESVDASTTATDVLRLAAGAEAHAKHPAALAILRHAGELGIETPEQNDFEVLAGRGVAADTADGRVLVGNERLLAEFGVPLSSQLTGILHSLRQNGDTIVCVAVDDRAVGVIGINDTIRLEAREGIVALRGAGVEHIIMCTGDSAEAAAVVAGQLGLEYRAEFLPEDKFALVTELKGQGRHIGMVGDGINDAPALALADVGIAMGTAGSDVAIEAADVALAGDDIRGVATVVSLSRKTLRLVRQNYALALGVNAIGIAVAASGALNPILAAVVHNLSTIAVVANSSRLINYEPNGDRRLAAPARQLISANGSDPGSLRER